MQFLKILFWVLVAFVAALFTYGNWGPVQIRLWNGQVAEVNLPLLLLATFLLGLVPTLLYHHAVRWRMRSRLATADRALEHLRLTLGAAPAPVVEPVAATGGPTDPVAS